MKRNFSIGNSNELIKGDRFYDLHNCFDFGGIDVSVRGELLLVFKPNPIYGHGYSIVLVFAQGVDRLAFSSDFDPAAIEDLDEMGYKSPGDEDDNWLLTQEQATDADDLFFGFNDLHFVRFYSKQVSLIELPASLNRT